MAKKKEYVFFVKHPAHSTVPVIAENWEQATVKAAAFWGVGWGKVAALVVGFLLGRWDKTVTEKQRIELVVGRLYVIMQEGDEQRKAEKRPERGEEWCAGATWILSRWMEGV